MKVRRDREGERGADLATERAGTVELGWRARRFLGPTEILG